MSEPGRDITCQELVELVTAYLEHALGPRETSQFEEHLALCDGCAIYVEQMRVTIDAVGRITVDDVPTETRDRLLTAFRGWPRA